MIEPEARVCARCGEPDSEEAVCSCGANLELMRGMLPTRAQWEAAQPELAGTVEDPGAVEEPVAVEKPGAVEEPAGLAATAEQVVEIPRPKRSLPRLPKPAGKRPAPPGGSNRTKQAISSVAIVVVFLVIFFVAKASNHKQSSTSASAVATTSATPASTATSASAAAAPTKPGAAPAPSVLRCASAWNGGRSPEHRHALDLTVVHDSSPVATIATYAGPNVQLARFGGGSRVVVSQNACIVISHHSVFIQQPNHNWGEVKAFRTYPLAVVAAPGNWALDHANVSIHAGPLQPRDQNLGVVEPRKDTLVILTSDDIGTAPKRR